MSLREIFETHTKENLYSEKELLLKQIDEQKQVVEKLASENNNLSDLVNKQSLLISQLSSTNGKITIRDLLKTISFNKQIFIKPSGNRIYFDGWTDDVPESLMDAIIIEIVPQIYKEDDFLAARKYYWGLGVWVNNIGEWDIMVDARRKLCWKAESKSAPKHIDFTSSLDREISIDDSNEIMPSGDNITEFPVDSSDIAAASEFDDLTQGTLDNFQPISFDGTKDSKGDSNIVCDSIDEQKPCYVLNIATKMIHLPSCFYAKNLDESHKEVSDQTLSSLRKKGYSPCGNCKP